MAVHTLIQLLRKRQNLQQLKMITKYKQMADNNDEEAINTIVVAT